jgi:hypothetical protein
MSDGTSLVTKASASKEKCLEVARNLAVLSHYLSFFE